MSCKITCPYCFGEMEDSEVLFRSEVVHQGECDILPDDYDGLEDFISLYNGQDKDQILNEYRDWMFFAEQPDDKYEAFWENFNGTTEYNPADDVLHVKGYYRKVIDPSLPDHRKYLQPQGANDYFIRDDQGMVTQIELRKEYYQRPSERFCHRRVCRYCHNPLTGSYGRNPVKFVTVIGITGAGKTVYLSQLLEKMGKYTIKAGLSAELGNPSIRAFRDKNRIVKKMPLPGSTPFAQLQQPLFYNLVRSGREDENKDERITETLVLYDVAGEVFRTPELVTRFAPFIGHADGVIVLIDPMQFEVISGVMNRGQVLDEPSTVMNAIYDIFSQNNKNEKCKVPFAVCISQADTVAVQQVLSNELREMLLEDVHGIKNASGFNVALFNASEYNPILEELYKFILENESVLAHQMEINYANYAYFAFTALGCDVDDYKKIRDDVYEKMRQESLKKHTELPAQYVRLNDENGEEGNDYPDDIFVRKDDGEFFTVKCPVGPVLPKRIEEPLLWLFHKLHYIGSDVPILDPTRPKITCPAPGCGSTNVEELPESERTVTTGRIFRKTQYFTHRCRDCGHRWDETRENGGQP